MENLVLQQALAVAIVVLREKILVLILEQTIVKLHYGIVVQRPPFALDQYHRGPETAVVGEHLCANLINSRVIENIPVFATIDYWYPRLAVDNEIGVNHYARTQ